MQRLLAILMIIFTPLLAFAKPTVEDVRVGIQKNGATRVVIESNQDIGGKVFTLPNPPRVVIDLKESKFKPHLSDIKQPPRSVVDGMRQGLFKPGITRMVVDLNAPASFKKFKINKDRRNGNRLVVDITPTGQKIETISPKTPAKIIPKPSSQIKTVDASILAPKSNKPHIKTEKEKKDHFVVVIDPGHGGVDPGAVGRSKTYEKNVVLAVAKKLKEELERDVNIKAYLTRSKDIYVPLRQRIKIAQKYDADLFISIHADAHKNRRVNGGSVYVLSEKSSDKEAARLARNANRGDLVAGIDLSHEPKDVRNILIDLSQRETMNQSALLGKEVIKEMNRSFKMRKSNVQFAGFVVLKAPEIPSILVELSYISNPTDEKNLNSSVMQRKMAQSLAKGARSYLTKFDHR